MAISLQRVLDGIVHDLENLPKRSHKPESTRIPRGCSFLVAKIRELASCPRATENQVKEVELLSNAPKLRQLLESPDEKPSDAIFLICRNLVDFFNGLETNSPIHSLKWDILRVNIQDYNKGIKGADTRESYTTFQRSLTQAFEEACFLSKHFGSEFRSTSTSPPDAARLGYHEASSKWSGYAEALNRDFQAFETRLRRFVPYADPTPGQAMEAFELIGARPMYAQYALETLFNLPRGLAVIGREYLGHDLEGLDSDLVPALKNFSTKYQTIEFLRTRIFPQPKQPDELRMDMLIATLESQKARNTPTCRVEEIPTGSPEPDG